MSNLNISGLTNNTLNSSGYYSYPSGIINISSRSGIYTTQTTQTIFDYGYVDKCNIEMYDGLEFSAVLDIFKSATGKYYMIV